MKGAALSPLIAKAKAVYIAYTTGQGDKFDSSKYQAIAGESELFFINKENGNIHVVNLCAIKKIVILPDKEKKKAKEEPQVEGEEINEIRI